MKKQVGVVLSAFLLLGFISVCFGPAQVAIRADEDSARVAVLLMGKIDDQGWNQSAYYGAQEGDKLEGVDVKVVEGIDLPDYERVMRDYAAQGYGLIVAHSTIAKEPVLNTAKDYPETMFLWTDGDTTRENVTVLVPMAHESSYLAGLLAGYMTKSGIVGTVGAMDVPSIHRSFAGFRDGLKAANPDAKLLVNWIGDFFNVSASYEAALSQINSGADVIFGSGGSMNLGILKAAKDKNVPVIGAVWDQYSVAPEVVITSVEWGLDEGILQAIKDFKNGTLKGEFRPLDLEHGSRLSPYHDNETLIPQVARTKADQAKSDILKGELKVKVEEK